MEFSRDECPSHKSRESLSFSYLFFFSWRVGPYSILVDAATFRTCAIVMDVADVKVSLIGRLFLHETNGVEATILSSSCTILGISKMSGASLSVASGWEDDSGMAIFVAR